MYSTDMSGTVGRLVPLAASNSCNVIKIMLIHQCQIATIRVASQGKQRAMADRDLLMVDCCW